MFTTCVSFSQALVYISLVSYDMELQMEDCFKDLSCKSVNASFMRVMACDSFSFPAVSQRNPTTSLKARAHFPLN